MQKIELAVLATFILVIGAGISLKIRTASVKAFRKLEQKVSNPRAFFMLAAIVVLMASFMGFYSLGNLSVENGQDQRLFFSYLSPVKNILSPFDHRHPGLYFALVHYPLILSGYSPIAVRAVSVLFYLLSIVLIGIAAKRWTGSLGATLAMIMLAFWPEYITRSREITDFSLLVASGIVSVIFYQRLLDRKGLKDEIYFAIVLGITLHTSYAAIIILCTFMLHAIYDSERRRLILKPFCLALLIGLPTIVRCCFMFPEEFIDRDQAAQYPIYMWGNWDITEVLQNSLREVFTASLTFAASTAFVVSAVANHEKLRIRKILILLVLLNGLFPLAAHFIRFKPYYALFFTAAFSLLYSSLVFQAGDDPKGLKGYIKLVSPLAGIIILLFSFSMDLHAMWHGMYPDTIENERSIKPIADAINKRGGKMAVIDIYYDVNPLSLFYFQNPYETWRNTREFDANSKSCVSYRKGKYPYYCEDAGSERKIVSLSDPSRFDHGWKEESKILLIELLKETSLYNVYNKHAPNEVVLGFLEKTCEQIISNEEYVLYFCKK